MRWCTKQARKEIKPWDCYLVEENVRVDAYERANVYRGKQEKWIQTISSIDFSFLVRSAFGNFDALRNEVQRIRITA